MSLVHWRLLSICGWVHPIDERCEQVSSCKKWTWKIPMRIWKAHLIAFVEKSIKQIWIKSYYNWTNKMKNHSWYVILFKYFCSFNFLLDSVPIFFFGFGTNFDFCEIGLKIQTWHLHREFLILQLLWMEHRRIRNCPWKSSNAGRRKDNLPSNNCWRVQIR